ncbi:MAG: hypothetical protein KHY89_09390 [Butyricicoccus pullicaecorum]|nr:hypothetical protein [Butyricicoccus pullicaecorum]
MKKILASILLLLMVLNLAACSQATPQAEADKIPSEIFSTLKSAGYVEDGSFSPVEKQEKNAKWGDYIYRAYGVLSGVYLYTCSNDNGDLLEICAYCDQSVIDATYSDIDIIYEAFGCMSAAMLNSIDNKNAPSVIQELGLDKVDLFLNSQNSTCTIDNVRYELVYNISTGRMFLTATKI